MTRFKPTSKPPTAIYMPPFKSSGDATHVAGLIATLRGLGKTQPDVYIGVSTRPQHRPHTRRSYDLLKAIGATVHLVRIRNSKCRASTASKRTRQATLQHNRSATACDQKVSSWLLNRLAHEHSACGIVKHTRQYLVGQPDKSVKQWAKRQVAAMLALAPRKLDFLAVHIKREADNQPQHVLSPGDLTAIKSEFHRHITSARRSAKVVVATLHTKPIVQAGRNFSAFPINTIGNDRMAFHHLLDHIRQRLGKKLYAVFGATSGILDAAALLGLPTISFHKYSGPWKRNLQDHREEAMLPFKRVVDRDNLRHNLRQNLRSALGADALRHIYSASAQQILERIGPTW